MVKTIQLELKYPKLRFPGFSDAWEEKKLGDVLKIGSGKDYKHLNPGNIPVFGTGGYMLSVDKALYSGESVFIGRKGTIDKPFYYNGDFWTVDTLFYTHSFKSVTPKFTNLLFENINWKKYNEASGVPSLSKSTLEKIKINIPGLSEQQKIAEFLSATDAWIENLWAQKKYFELYKKGMMQKIFAQEICFKTEDGKDFTEWEEKKLGDIVENNGGTSLEEYVSQDGEYKFVSIGNYSKDGKYIDDNKRIVLNEKTKNKMLNKEDLVMVLNDKTASGDIIGSTILIDKNNTYIYNQRSERLTVDRKFVVPVYLWFFLNSRLFRHAIVKSAQGGTQIYVNFSSVKKFKIKIPTVIEQQKIADFLTSLDNLIESKQQQITQAEQWKNGLMQGLFV